jgi:hypothetical protein
MYLTWGGAVGIDAMSSSWSLRSHTAAAPPAGNVSTRDEAYLSSEPKERGRVSLSRLPVEIQRRASQRRGEE